MLTYSETMGNTYQWILFEIQMFSFKNIFINVMCEMSAILLSGGCTILDIYPKLILNTNLAKSRSSITCVSVIQSFWNFAQSMTVSLPCSVQNFKMIEQLWNKLWSKETLLDLSLTHLPLDKMATILQTTFSKAFCWMKMLEFWLKCHWSLFLRV